MAGMGVDFKQLQTAVEWSIRQFETPRKKRVDAVRQYVGAHYSDNGSSKVVPTNFLEMAVTIYMHQLAARAPRCTFKAKVPRLKPFAYSTQIALNQIPDEIGLDKTFRTAVMEALFSIGIVKTGICLSGETVEGHDIGQVFADVVSIDDYFCDMSAKSRSAIQFEGNDYWLPIEDVRNMWEGKTEQIKPDDHTVMGSQGEERAEGISSDEGADLYKEKVYLRDVWIPRTRKMVTYAVTSKKVLNIVDWDGPDNGPYHILGYSEVPGNLLPLPPVALWRDLHELANILFRKLGRQADAKKTVATFPGGNDEDVERLRNADDGQGIKYTGAKPEMITVGGIDQSALALFLQTKDMFVYSAGNLDALGGLAPMSDTIGQDQMLQQSASARTEYMRQKTLDFARGIFKDIAWYEWTNPVSDRTIEKPLKGTSITVQSKWSEETRDGDWLDFNFDIDAYSMQADTPASKLQKIGQTLERFVFPILPMLQQQGAQVNFEELFKQIAELSNIPELNDIIQFGEPQQGQPEQGNQTPEMSMPSNTHRTYERVNRPGATRHGKDDVMARGLMGIGVQKDEMAAATRSVS